MELFWTRVEVCASQARLPPPERDEARWIVGQSVIDRNEISFNQIRTLADLLSETGSKKSIVSGDIAKFEATIRSVHQRFKQVRF